MERLSKLLSIISRKKQLALRLFLVWGLGLLIFNYDENNFDYRFKLRSDQPTDNSIVLVNISKEEWDYTQNPAFIRRLRREAPISDSYFWDSRHWRPFLRNILKDNPKSVLVDLFFDKSVRAGFLGDNIFINPKTIWRGETGPRRSLLIPKFGESRYRDSKTFRSNYLYNVGTGAVFHDNDSVARKYERIRPRYSRALDVPQKVIEFSNPNLIESIPLRKRFFINFRGTSGSFQKVSFREVLTKSVGTDFFKDKIVIIGSDSRAEHFINTPVGQLTRSEYYANVIDSYKNKRWINFFHPLTYVFYLLLVAGICFLIISSYPQAISISFLVLLSVLLTSASIILFDIFNIWLPIVSTLATILLSYIILLNQLLSQSEYLTWKSKKKEESLIEMNELKNNFVSLFSHDLKTPLAKIQSIATRVAGDIHATDQIKEDLHKIQKETKELDRYIQSILQVTRIEAGEFNLHTVPIDINELIEDAIELMKPLAQEKNISISFESEPLFSIELDAKLIKEVFINILENSIKYSPDGSNIKIQSQDSESGVLLSFADNGPGIPKEEQEAIFEKFYRSKRDLKVKKGTGLGLYLVRYFIEIHHGSVSLDKQHTPGTKFKIKLPFEQKHNEVLND